MRAETAALDLVLPRSCVGCGTASTPWCAACRPPAGRLRIRLAGRPVVARAAYAGAVRVAVLSHKERGRRDLAAPLAELLAAAVAGVPGHRRALLVPVPSRRAAVRARGGDQVGRLARGAARRLGLEVVAALTVDDTVRDSAGLHAAERATNLRHAVHARPGGGRAAVVVDDIATTGASLRAAFAALDAAGWTVLGAAVIAATPPPDDHRGTGGAQGPGLR